MYRWSTSRRYRWLKIIVLDDVPLRWCCDLQQYIFFWDLELWMDIV
jgi:hypothetical protein